MSTYDSGCPRCGQPALSERECCGACGRYHHAACWTGICAACGGRQSLREMDLERAVRRARLRTLLMALVGLDVLVWAASFLVRWEIPVSDLLAVRPLGLLRWGLLGLVILVLLRR